MKKIIKVIVIAFLFLTNLQLVLAQNTGHLKGRISDTLNAAVANNKAVIENTTSKFEIVTNENGEFDIALPVGVYQVRTEKIEGYFAYQRDKIEVKSNRETKLKIKLKLSLEEASCVLVITSSPIKKKENTIKK